jgi:glucose-1-phosphate cytidylyltransferase
MKVVLFCGGLGMRMREFSERIPKPMVTIGYRPILWHVMKYYAHYGHKDFILCLGYKADIVKKYFLEYEETLSNDFVMTGGGKQVELLNSDIDDWRITFVDTGLNSNIGQRLKAVEKYLEGEEAFLANYSDGLTDIPLPVMIDCFNEHGKTACCICVNSTQSFHIVSVSDDTSLVKSIQPIGHSHMWINGGFYVFSKDIFNYIKEGEDLVEEPFNRLIEAGELVGYRYDGFWTAMDTFKDKQHLDDLFGSGQAPWLVWE